MSDPTTPQDSAATHDPEGPLCYGFTRDGVWLDTRLGWVIPDDAVADVCEAGPTSQRSAAQSAASRGSVVCGMTQQENRNALQRN
jgi:hypothetical protein